MNEQLSLVAPSDIAEMAGVTRAAVSNWRKRADDFPEPLGGTPAKPLFARDAVEQWLVDNDKKVVKQGGGAHLWAALNATRGHLRLGQTAALMLTLASVRKLILDFPNYPSVWSRLVDANPTDLASELRSMAEEFSHDDPRWGELVLKPLRQGLLDPMPPAAFASLIDAFDELYGPELAESADFTLERLAKAGIREGLDQGFVGSRTAHLLATLARTHKQGTLYDPACGIAAAMTGAVAAGFRPDRVVGHDIDQNAVVQAAQRCFLHDVPAEFQTADVIAADPDRELRADVIVAEPPFGLHLTQALDIADRRWTFGMPAKSSEMAWIQHVVAHLAEGGCGYVLTPAGTLFNGTAKAVRAELIRRGCVEAIVALPVRMLPHMSVGLAVWVLKPPHESNRADIHFLDASSTEDAERGVAASLEMLRGGKAVDLPHAQVDVRDVLAADANLTPNRWIQALAPDPTELVGAYENNWRNLNAALDHLQGASESLKQLAGTTEARIFTIGELVDQGLIDLRQGRANPKDIPDNLQHRVVTHRTLRDGELADALDDEQPVPANLTSSITTEQDVLVSTQHSVKARVDWSGAHLAAVGVHRLRVTNPQQLSARYLALVLPGRWNDRFQAGTTVTRADVRLLEVPLIPVAEQRDVVLADVAVGALAEEARKLLASADGVRDHLIEALRYNVELPAGDQ